VARAGSGPGPNPTCGLRLGLLLHKPKARACAAWFLGEACSPDPEPANQARPTKAQARSIKLEPNPSMHFTGPTRPNLWCQNNSFKATISIGLVYRSKTNHQCLDFQWHYWKSLVNCLRLPVMSLEVPQVLTSVVFDASARQTYTYSSLAICQLTVCLPTFSFTSFT
jgi:hypothetical protein